jgi:hypothetical protein
MTFSCRMMLRFSTKQNLRVHKHSRGCLAYLLNACYFSCSPTNAESCMSTYSHLWLCCCRGMYVLHLQCISLTTADFLLDSLHVCSIISWYSLPYLAVLTQTKSFYRAQWQSGWFDLEVAQFECPPTFLLSPSMLITAATISTNISRDFRSTSHDYHCILRFAELSLKLTQTRQLDYALIIKKLF